MRTQSQLSPASLYLMERSSSNIQKKTLMNYILILKNFKQQSLLMEIILIGISSNFVLEQTLNSLTYFQSTFGSWVFLFAKEYPKNQSIFCILKAHGLLNQNLKQIDGALAPRLYSKYKYDGEEQAMTILKIYNASDVFYLRYLTEWYYQDLRKRVNQEYPGEKAQEQDYKFSKDKEQSCSALFGSKKQNTIQRRFLKRLENGIF